MFRGPNDEKVQVADPVGGTDEFTRRPTGGDGETVRPFEDKNI